MHGIQVITTQKGHLPSFCRCFKHLNHRQHLFSFQTGTPRFCFHPSDLPSALLCSLFLLFDVNGVCYTFQAVFWPIFCFPSLVILLSSFLCFSLGPFLVISSTSKPFHQTLSHGVQPSREARRRSASLFVRFGASNRPVSTSLLWTIQRPKRADRAVYQQLPPRNQKQSSLYYLRQDDKRGNFPHVPLFFHFKVITVFQVVEKAIHLMNARQLALFLFRYVCMHLWCIYFTLYFVITIL